MSYAESVDICLIRRGDEITHHDDVIKWKYFPRYWPFVREIHRSPVNSLHKGQWRRALMFSLTCAWIHGWVNNREAGVSRRYSAHYGVTVMTALRIQFEIWVLMMMKYSCTWSLHYNHITWGPWCYYTPETQLFVLPLVQSENRKTQNSALLIRVEENPLDVIQPVNSPHK